MHITKKFLRQNKLLNLILVFFSFLFFLIMYFMLININSSKIEINSVNKFQDKNFYQLTDNLVDQREVSFFSVKENYNVINNFVNEIINNETIDYYNVVWQPIGLNAYPNKSEFSSYYEFDGMDDIYEKENKKFRASKSIQISQKVLEYNSIQLNSGTFFEEEDYYFDPNDRTIPILLGYDYKEYYSLNDTLTLDYYGEEFSGKIIGFMERNQSIFSKTDPQLILDRYIILPSIIFNDNPTDILNTDKISELFIKASLLSKTAGNIITDLDALEVKALVNAAEVATGFKDYQIIGANSVTINLLSQMVEANQFMIVLITIVSFIIINGLFYFVLRFKVKKGLDTYLVLIISGIQNNTIQKAILNEIIIINTIGMLGASLILFLMFNGLTTLLFTLLIIVFIILILQILIAKLLIKRIFLTTNVVEKLKGD